MTLKTCRCGGTLALFDFRGEDAEHRQYCVGAKASGFPDPRGLKCDKCKKTYGMSDEGSYRPVMKMKVTKGKHPKQTKTEAMVEQAWSTIARWLPESWNVTVFINGEVSKRTRGGTWEIVERWGMVKQPHATGPTPTTKETSRAEKPPKVSKVSTFQDWLDAIVQEVENGTWTEEQPDEPYTPKPLGLWDPARYLGEGHENDDAS